MNTRGHIGDKIFAVKSFALIGAFLLPVLLSLAVPESSSFWIFTISEIFIFAIVVLSYDLLYGYTGYLSFGHALFFGGATYFVTMFMVHVDVGFFFAFLLMFASVFVLSIIVGSISLRLTGVYFAIITLAFAQIGYNLIWDLDAITGGEDGLGPVFMPEIMGVRLDDPMLAYYLLLVLLLTTYYFLYRLINSPFGTVLQGIRENEERLQMLGIDTYRYKLASFTLSGIIAGIGGGLYLLFINFASPSLLHWLTTGDILLMTLFGGAGTLYGPILGAIFFISAETVLKDIFDQWRILFGVIFILFVLYEPRGFAGIIENYLDSSEDD